MVIRLIYMKSANGGRDPSTARLRRSAQDEGYLLPGWRDRSSVTICYPLRPSGTSPKYDKLMPEYGFKVSIVVFGGGWVGVERREKALCELGLKIVRFKNDEVVKDLSAVVGKIKSLISK